MLYDGKRLHPSSSSGHPQLTSTTIWLFQATAASSQVLLRCTPSSRTLQGCFCCLFIFSFTNIPGIFVQRAITPVFQDNLLTPAPHHAIMHFWPPHNWKRQWTHLLIPYLHIFTSFPVSLMQPPKSFFTSLRHWFCHVVCVAVSGVFGFPCGLDKSDKCKYTFAPEIP